MAVGVGGKTKVLQGVNPAETTVRDFFGKYVEELYPESNRMKDGKLKYQADRKSYLSFVLNSPELKPYLDQPIKKIFEDTLKDPQNNPTIKYVNSKRHAGQTLVTNRRYFVALQGQMDYGQTHFKNARLKEPINIVEGVVFPPKGTPKARVSKFDHRKGGRVAAAIAQAGAKNPANEEIARAALWMLHTAARPDEMGNLTIGSLVSTDIVDDATGDTVKHRGFRIYEAKNKKWTDYPAGPRGLAIFHEQLEILKKQGVPLNANQPLFPNVKTDDVTQFLKELRIPNLRQIVSEGDLKWVDYFDEAYDLRRFTLQSYGSQPNMTPEKLDMVTGRDISQAMKGKSAASHYLGKPIGQYEPWMYDIIRENDVNYTKQLNTFIRGKGLLPNHMIDMNINMIEVAKGNQKIKTIPMDQPQVIHNKVDPSEINVEFGESKPALGDSDVIEAVEGKDYKVVDEIDEMLTDRKDLLEGYGRFDAVTFGAAVGTAGFIAKKAIAQIPPIGAGMEAYDAYVNKELGVAESAVRGLSEFLPVSIADVEMGRDVGQWLAKNRDFYEAESKKGFEKARRMLSERNLVQSEEEQSFLSEGQQ